MRRFYCVGLGIAGLLWGMIVTPAVSAGELTERERADILQAVAETLPKWHLTVTAFDDELSRRWLQSFLKRLDPHKLYLTQADFKHFALQQNELDDLTRQGDCRFAEEVFKVFSERVDNRVEIALEFLAAVHDFTVEEEFVLDADRRAYVADEPAARELWRKKVKYDLLVNKVLEVQDAQSRERLARRYRAFANRTRQTLIHDVLEEYLSSLTKACDPRSEYLSIERVDEFNVGLIGPLVGIGIHLELDDEFARVSWIAPSGPAGKDGRLKIGDQITGIGEGKEGGLRSLSGLRMQEIRRLLLSYHKLSSIRIEVIPASQAETASYQIPRGYIEREKPRGSVLESVKKSDGTPFKIGYVQVPQIYWRVEDDDGTADEVRRLFTDPTTGFQAVGIDAVLLNLRRISHSRPLSQAIGVANLFIEKGPAMKIKTRQNRPKQVGLEGQELIWDGPLVVLTSKLTTCNAEVIAAVIQDYGRGLIVGDSTTFGSGSTQTSVEPGRNGDLLFSHPKRGVMNLTIQRFYRVNGDSLQQKGVTPDVVLSSVLDLLPIGDTHQPNTIPFDRIDAVSHLDSGRVRPEYKTILQAASAKRRAKIAEFQKLDEELVLQQLRRPAATVRLREEDVRRQLQQDDSANAAKVAETAFDAGYYLEEVLEIVRDYTGLVHAKNAD